MEVDFKILKQDVKFPLSWDTIEYKMYIFDANLEMVAQVDLYNTSEWKENHPFAKLLGKMKTGERTVESHQYFLDSGDFYDREKGVRIGCVRGWGRLQYKPAPEKRQDNIAQYILQCINEELV